MKYLPFTAAGVVLLAGSMSVYAQTEMQRPLQPDSSMGQGQQGGSDANRNAPDNDPRDGKGAERGDKDRGDSKGAERGDNDRGDSKGAERGDNDRRDSKSKAKPREASSKIQPQQKTIIKQRIVERNVKRSHVNFSVSVGASVPRTVVLYDLPAEIIEIAPAYREFKYVLTDNDTILVIDPDTWEIVDVIEI